VVVVLALGYQFGLPAVQSLFSGADEAPADVYVNRASILLEQGGSAIEALEEAHTALRHNQTDENAAILDKVRTAFIEEIQGLLGARRYEQAELDKASELAQRAARVDHSPEIGALVD